MRTSVTVRSRRPAWLFFAFLFLFAVGMVVFQLYHVKKHRPLIEAELAQAEAEGEGVFERLGVPAGSEALGPGDKRYGARGRKSMSAGVRCGITWEREFDAPGDFASIAADYHARLERDGWRVIDDSPPSTVQHEFKRGKWFVTLWSRGDFTHPPRTKLHVKLEWDYWHSAE